MGEIGSEANSFGKTPGRLYVMRRPVGSPYPYPNGKRDVHQGGTKESSAVSIKKWWNSPKLKHKRRVTKYQYYALEGKVKASFKKGCRWVKKTCSKFVPGL